MTNPPRHLLVRARGEQSPLSLVADGSVPDLALPAALAGRLAGWAARRPADGFASRPVLRRHVEQGLVVVRALAGHLGPGWAVRYWDERRGEERFVCWGCGETFLTYEAYGDPPHHPLHITLLGEYRAHPVRKGAYDDFPPDDPQAALGLSATLAADLSAWARDIDAAMNTWLADRDDARWDAAVLRLHEEGETLAERLATELAPGRTVTYQGVQGVSCALLGTRLANPVEPVGVN
ncbi:hypothetical protein [Streptomyces sp. NBC_01235]|uniref:hypothetical protein n=1 Tax=Streptomyces sp. NBC_01235 TaxID=2903788 RepID=UPI002E161700|nr:hypothetical protein OG289_20250 [Streptomyces sp. NBC_01235]